MASDNDVLSYEILAQRAQRLLSERPVVVLGTGATIPHGLPSMSDLADLLLAAVEGNPPGWGEFSQRLEEIKDLEVALHEVPLPDETVDRLVSATWEIVSARDAAFYDRLVQGLEAFPLAELFGHLLRTADPQIQVVTTNYDRVAEYAANSVGAYVSTGLTAGWLQRFVPAAAGNERQPSPGYQGKVSLLKVHGSLDWFSDAMGDIVGVPLASSVPAGARALVVTPGVGKYRKVHSDPFRTVLSAADSALRKATCYLCVGFGFADEHVQPILASRVLRHDVPLMIVTRTLSAAARKLFLSSPPKRFLFLEMAPGGTTAYDPDHPTGTRLDGVSLWKLGDFMRLIAGEKARR